MSLIPLGIISSFAVLIIAILAYAARILWGRQPWERIYHVAGCIAITLYAVSAVALFADGQAWSTFKLEVAELLAVYVIAAGSFFLSWKRVGIAISHSIILILLLALALAMHIKWSGWL